MNLSEIAKQLETAQRARRLKEHSRPWSPTMTPVTSLGYACERRSVYHRTRPEMAQPIGEELASIFEEGNLHQKDVRAELLELGFEVVEAEVNFKDLRLEITGTIDGKIEIKDPDARHGKRRVPVEIKSTMGNSPRTAEEWRDSESALLRRYYSQLETYMFLTNEPDGLGIFKDKATGLWTVCPIALDYEHVEGILQRAARIRDAVALVREGGEDFLPPRQEDRSDCGGCPWRETLCHPEQAPADPLLLAEDEQLAAQIAKREELDGPRKAFDKLDGQIKTRFKLTAGDRFVVGAEWLVEKRKHGAGVRIDIKRLNLAEPRAEQ